MGTRMIVFAAVLALGLGIALASGTAGSLDTAPGVGPKIHIHVGSKASWFEITDELPQLEEGVARAGRPSR